MLLIRHEFTATPKIAKINIQQLKAATVNPREYDWSGAGEATEGINPLLRLPVEKGPLGLCRAPRGRRAGRGRGREGEGGREELGPYLVSSGSVGAGVAPKSRELLLQPAVGAVPKAVGDPRDRQDPSDASEGEEGEKKEFGGLCLFPALRERRDVAFLQGRRERQRLSCAVAEKRGAPVGGEAPGSANFEPRMEANGGAGTAVRTCPPSIPSPPRPAACI